MSDLNTPPQQVHAMLAAHPVLSSWSEQFEDVASVWGNVKQHILILYPLKDDRPDCIKLLFQCCRVLSGTSKTATQSSSASSDHIDRKQDAKAPGYDTEAAKAVGQFAHASFSTLEAMEAAYNRIRIQTLPPALVTDLEQAQSSHIRFIKQSAVVRLQCWFRRNQ